MAYTTINKSTDYFNTKLYTGTGSTNAITGVGFQPDWTWIKNRDGTDDHKTFDAVRGVTKVLKTNTTGPETTDSNTLSAFGTDGFTVGSDGGVNGNGDNFASWNWKAGTGQGSPNTDGSINTSYTSVNTTAGFSISKYAGYGSASTVGHGLGAAPEVIIIKSTTHTENWVMYHKGLNPSGAGNYIYFNNAAVGGSGSNTSIFNNTAPTSSVFSVNTDGVSNGSGKSYVAYCFKEKPGYSKFGTYVGNGNADGTFVYTGFKPAFVLVKRYDGAGLSWRFFDSKRNYNGDREFMYVNLSDSEVGGDNMDFLSNGFKNRNTSGHQNGNGDDYIYMAFGQSLVGTNNIPATAR